MAETRGKARMDHAVHHGNKKQKVDTAAAAKAVEVVRQRDSEFEDFFKTLMNSISMDEAREMLELNVPGSSLFGTDEEILRRLADLMFYGPLEACALCGGAMGFNESEFSCTGFFSEWTKCDYITREDSTKLDEWKIPEGTRNTYLKEWKKNQAGRKRPMRQPSAENRFLDGMKIALTSRLSRTQPEYRREIEKCGGIVVASLSEGVTCLVIPDDEMPLDSSKYMDAVENNVLIVKESWLRECVEKMKRIPFDEYLVSPKVPSESAVEEILMTPLKMAGKRDIHKDSGIESPAKIFERDGIIYNCAFAACDFFAGLNHYAVLQLIELIDNGTIYLYYKRGRAGERGKDDRLEEQSSPEKGIEEFAKLFENVTGNGFEQWEREKKFTKKFSKFSPIDMLPGYDACAGALHPSQQVPGCVAHTKLVPHIAELCKLLFSQLTYRYAIADYNHVWPDLPQGNLSDFHLHRCEEVLHAFAKYIRDRKDEEKKRALRCLDYSNRWYSLLYSIDPLILTDIAELAGLAAGALECVRDISVASQFIGNMAQETSLDDPFADRYNKLNHKFWLVDKRSPDFNMVQNYLHKTYEPVRIGKRSYKIHLQHVYEIDYPDRASADKRKNRYLLWCGAKPASLIRVLQRGFLPAVFEAPVPGYLFGEGVYCSDAAARAAQLSFAPLGKRDAVLMLSIVSMGEVVLELTKPEKDVSEYKKEKLDIKALGRRKPKPSEFIRWRDNVVVPSGSLVDSGIKDPILDYDEYVVYDPNQVRLTYLVSVVFEEAARTRTRG